MLDYHRLNQIRLKFYQNHTNAMKIFQKVKSSFDEQNNKMEKIFQKIEPFFDHHHPDTR